MLILEKEISKFFNYDILYDDPFTSAKALIRPCIKAPDGRLIIVLDYRSIENVGLLWASDQDDLLTDFKNGRDLYKVMAANLFNIVYENVNKNQRFHGKTLELGAGYCLSGPGYVKYAESFGLMGLTEEDGEHAISTYRESHSRVELFWKGVARAAMSAMRGKPRAFRGCKFKKIIDRNHRMWLVLGLPSGRNLYYADPFIDEEGKWGPAIRHFGINSYTSKWSVLNLTRGRITENIIQAICRDILATAVHNLLAIGYKVILHVHDEILVEVDKAVAKEEYDRIVEIMEIVPKWAKGMPIKTEGFITKRYRKD